MEEILQLLEERILEHMSTSEQLKGMIEEEISTRWEQLVSIRLDHLEKTVHDLQQRTPRRRWEDKFQRLENTVCELESSVRQQLATSSRDAGCLAGQAAGAALMRNSPASARMLAAVQVVDAADNSYASRCRLPSLSGALAVSLFVFGPLVQTILWIAALADLVPDMWSSVAGHRERDGQLSIWLPVGWWHITHLTGLMHSLATLAAGPATPRMLRTGNMLRSLSMYLPGVLYCAARSMDCSMALFATLTIFGTSDCTLNHPLILELLKAVMPQMGELDSGMHWRAGWLRRHRARAGDVVRARLLKAACGSLALLVPYVCLGHCAVRNRLVDIDEDPCLGLGLANLLVGVTITWLCCSSFEELCLPLAAAPPNFRACCWSVGLAPAAVVALALLIKDAGNGDILCPEVAYLLLAFALNVLTAVLLTRAPFCCCVCSRRKRNIDPPWPHIPDSCRCSDRESAEVRAQWWPESWPLLTGPWGTVCVSPRTRLPLFVVDYSSCVDIVDLRRPLNNDEAKLEGRAGQAKAKPRKWRYAAADIDQAMLREVISSHSRATCGRRNRASGNWDWPAVLIWTLNSAVLNQDHDHRQDSRQGRQKAPVLPESVSILSDRPVLVCQVLQKKRRGIRSRSRSSESKRFALKLRRSRDAEKAENRCMLDKGDSSPAVMSSDAEEVDVPRVLNDADGSQSPAVTTGMEANSQTPAEQDRENMCVQEQDQVVAVVPSSLQGSFWQCDGPSQDVEVAPSSFGGDVLHLHSDDSDHGHDDDIDPPISNPNSPQSLRSTADLIAHGAEIAQRMEYDHVPERASTDTAADDQDDDAGLEQCALVAAVQPSSASMSGFSL